MSDKNASTSVGRDELAALLGASRASDLVAAANDDTKKSTSTDTVPKSRLRNRKDDAEDVSKMDRAQAAALVAKKFGSGTQPNSAAAGMRHRVAGKRKRQYQLLANDLTEDSSAINAIKEGNVVDYYLDEGTRDEDDSKFQIARNSGVGGGKRKKLVIKRGGEDNTNHRRSGNDSDSSSASASSSTSLSRSSSSSDDESKPMRRRPRSNSSSSSSDEDEADLRRKRARVKAQRIQNEAVVLSVRGTNEGSNGNRSKAQRREVIDEVRVGSTKQFKEGESLSKKKKHTASSNSSESGSSSSDDDSSTSSSSDSSESSASSEEDVNPVSVSKPLFVPKSKRGTVAEVEAQLKKHEEAEERRMREKERRAVQSRALVAEAVSAAVATSQGMDDGDEFDTGEVGGDFILVPDDSDPVDSDLVLAERDAWEVREIIRILRDVDEGLESEKERKEIERRRVLTDHERLEEDRRSGRYRAPGEMRRVRREGEKNGGNNYLQRYHHRGAFYLDDDTLKRAGKDDIRHKAKAYSRSVTGDRIDKRSLPEVMQVKNFGLAGYSTKYKGLAKEDTTDKSLDFLPISGKNGKR